MVQLGRGVFREYKAAEHKPRYSVGSTSTMRQSIIVQRGSTVRPISPRLVFLGAINQAWQFKPPPGGGGSGKTGAVACICIDIYDIRSRANFAFYP